MYVSNGDGTFEEVFGLNYNYYGVQMQTGDFNDNGKDDNSRMAMDSIKLKLWQNIR